MESQWYSTYSADMPPAIRNFIEELDGTKSEKTDLVQGFSQLIQQAKHGGLPEYQIDRKIDAHIKQARSAGVKHAAEVYALVVQTYGKEDIQEQSFYVVDDNEQRILQAFLAADGNSSALEGLQYVAGQVGQVYERAVECNVSWVHFYDLGGKEK
eukprot:6420890-Amphidinium_carterae.1